MVLFGGVFFFHFVFTLFGWWGGLFFCFGGLWFLPCFSSVPSDDSIGSLKTPRRTEWLRLEVTSGDHLNSTALLEGDQGGFPVSPGVLYNLSKPHFGESKIAQKFFLLQN